MYRSLACLLLIFSYCHAQVVVTDDSSTRRSPRAQKRSAAKSEDARSPKEKAAADEAAAQLLQRAYSLVPQLSDSDRPLLLARLAQASARKQPKKSVAWAEESFALSETLSGQQRTQAQMLAVSSAAQNDSQVALQLLARMQPPTPRDDGTTPPDLRSALAVTLFQRHWSKHGIEGLDALISAAHQLGESGAYPYMAVGSLLHSLQQKDPEQAQSLLNDALAFISRRDRSTMANQQLVSFLQDNQKLISRALLKEIVQQLVADASSNTGEGTHASATLADETGRSVELSSGSFMIMQLMPLIRQVDPDWAKKLEEQKADLRAASSIGGNSRNLNMTLGVNAPGGSGGPPPDMREEMTSMRVDDLSSRDPQGALKLASQLRDPSRRAAANAEIAAGLSKSDPEQAAALLKQARDAIAQTKEPADKLRILVGLAQAQSAMGDTDAFLDTLDHSYTLGEEIFRAGIDKNPSTPVFTQPGFESLARLTHEAAKSNLIQTLASIENLRSAVLQAHLFIGAAEGLDPENRFHPPRAGVRVEVERRN